MAEEYPGQDKRRGLVGRYANFLEVGFNDAEFLLDFGQQYEGSEPLIHTRVITSPAYVRGFITLLADSAAAYEKSGGKTDSKRGESE